MRKILNKALDICIAGLLVAVIALAVHSNVKAQTDLYVQPDPRLDMYVIQLADGGVALCATRKLSEDRELGLCRPAEEVLKAFQLNGINLIYSIPEENEGTAL